MGMGKVIPATIDSEGDSYARTFKANKVLIDNGDEPGSIWLTPNMQAGWFILDLQDEVSVSGFAMRNTQNGKFKDRWTKNFKIEASKDKKKWTTAASGKLEPNLELMYTHSSVSSMRYVKFNIKDYGG